MTTESEVLLREAIGAVWVATINRPTKGNSLSRDVIRALDDLALDVESSLGRGKGPKVLVITGAGQRVFSAGADVSELDGIGSTAAYEQMRRGQSVFSRLEDLPITVIAAVNGFALGGGLELAMAADLRVAATTARLGQPEINLANLPGWGGTQRLPLLVGVGRATELILTGDLIDADHARSIGLVNRVADDALAAAMTLATQIAGKSGVAVAGAKRAIRAGLREGVAVGYDVEARAVGDCCDTLEQQAAVRAFLTKKARPADG